MCMYSVRGVFCLPVASIDRSLFVSPMYRVRVALVSADGGTTVVRCRIGHYNLWSIFELATGAWEFGKDSWNSYLAVVNPQIVPKVGEPFELIV